MEGIYYSVLLLALKSVDSGIRMRNRFNLLGVHPQFKDKENAIYRGCYKIFFASVDYGISYWCSKG